MTLIALMLYDIPSEFLFKFCFYLFVFWLGGGRETSLVMTYHLHQWDTISYLSLESLKLISQIRV